MQFSALLLKWLEGKTMLLNLAIIYDQLSGEKTLFGCSSSDLSCTI
jgi:hypothetical protein